MKIQNLQHRIRRNLNFFSYKNNLIVLSLIFILCLMFKTSNAQDTLTTVPYNYSTMQRWQPNALVHTQYDRYYEVGQTDTLGAGNSNVFIIESDPNNNMDTVRTKVINFYKDDVAYSIKETYNGNLLISGFETYSINEIDGLYFEVDTTCATVWGKSLAFGSNTQVKFYASTITPFDSGAAFTGYYKNSSSVQNICLLKTKPNGDTLWFKTYSGPTLTNNVGYSVYNTADNGFVVAGTVKSSIDGLPKIYIIRTDSLGNSLWTQTIGDSSTSCVAKSIIQEKSLDLAIAGSIDTSAFFGELGIGGDDIILFKIYPNACANSLIVADSGYYILSGNTVPNVSTPPQAWVIDLNILGEILDTIQYESGDKGIITNSVFDIVRNGFVACATYIQSGTSTSYSSIVSSSPIGGNPFINTLCNIYYERATRMVYTHNSSLGDNHYLQDILEWDCNHSLTYPNSETGNLIWLLKRNHITKLIIDGLYYDTPVNNCASGPYHGLLADHCGLTDERCLLANFIHLARANGVTKVYATIQNAAELYTGSIVECEKEIDQVYAYNTTNMNTLCSYIFSDFKIDGFWIDYEFWDSQYCTGIGVSGVDVTQTVPSVTDGCGTVHSGTYTINDHQFIIGKNSSTYGGTFTEFGFTQLSKLIDYANTPQSYTMTLKPEILIESGMNWNNAEKIKIVSTGVSTSYPAFALGISSGPYFQCNGSLTQALFFAKYLEEIRTDIGSIAVDLTTSDSRVTEGQDAYTAFCVDPSACNMQWDINHCLGLAPIYFLDNIVDNSNVYENATILATATTNFCNQITTHCTGSDIHTDHFDAGAKRQRCFDYLGSFGGPTSPVICPYFSVQNPVLNPGSPPQNCLGNYMTGDLNPNGPTSTHNYNPALGICTTSTTNASNIHYLPEIHAKFIKQYKNSNFYSFNNIHALYTDGIYGAFNYSGTGHPHWGLKQTIKLGSFEWFPMGEYPLVLDNHTSGAGAFPYQNASRRDAFAGDGTYPALVAPVGTRPPMYFLGSFDRSADGDYDLKNLCRDPGPVLYHSRKSNPNKVASLALSLSAKIYPNPSDGNYNLSYTLPSGKGNLIITDITGREVYNLNIFNATGIKRIDISNLGNGIYYWKLIDDGGNYNSGRITIIKLK